MRKDEDRTAEYVKIKIAVGVFLLLTLLNGSGGVLLCFMLPFLFYFTSKDDIANRIAGKNDCTYSSDFDDFDCYDSEIDASSSELSDELSRKLYQQFWENDLIKIIGGIAGGVGSLEAIFIVVACLYAYRLHIKSGAERTLAKAVESGQALYGAVGRTAAFINKPDSPEEIDGLTNDL